MPQDNLLSDAIADDFGLFDRLEDVVHQHFLREANLDFVAGTSTPGEETHTITGCLFRSSNSRVSQSVQKIRERFRAIQDDEIPKLDTVLEIPVVNTIVKPDDGDFITRVSTGQRYQIIAVDYCVFETRYRIGLVRL